MEKWLVLLSVFKNFLQTEIKNTWWSWAKDISLSILKLVSLGVVGFAFWALYSYLRGYHEEGVAAFQMAGILLGVLVVTILLFLLIKKIVKKYLKYKAKNAYGELFDLSGDLYKEVEKMKDISATVFKRNPVLISCVILGGAFLVSKLFKNQKKEIYYGRKS